MLARPEKHVADHTTKRTTIHVADHTTIHNHFSFFNFYILLHFPFTPRAGQVKARRECGVSSFTRELFLSNKIK